VEIFYSVGRTLKVSPISPPLPFSLSSVPIKTKEKKNEKIEI
jgi:hypothetical protein